MLYFDLAGFEGGLPALHCALQGIRPERLVFASDYPQDFTGVKHRHWEGDAGIKKLHRYDPEAAPRRGNQGGDLRHYGDGFVKGLEFCC